MIPNPHFVNKPPPADKRVDEIHIWIATHANGGEGVMAADMPYGLPGHVRHVPLMASSRATAERFSDLAHELQSIAAREGEFITLELRSFIRKP